jgi:protein-arginine kinase activator protein McsA
VESKSEEAESVEELEMALEKAIKDENYELASVLRDKIKKQK